MIWLDVTKSAAARHRSGLTRVTMRLADELGDAAKRWSGLPQPARRAGDSSRCPIAPADTFLTAEVFAPSERPGFAQFLARRPCRLTAIYHDSIPLRLPHITWPQAVARHPAYVSMLAQFDLVWAVSAASRDELLNFWRWQGRAPVPEVRVLPLGSDLAQAGSPNPLDPGGAGCLNTPNLGVAGCPNPLAAPGAPAAATSPVWSSAAAEKANGVPSLLCVGILEPRKNQSFLLEVADRLWAENLRFELRFVGRVNPHFGRPILAQIRSLQRKRPGLFYDGAVSDQQLAALYRRATACVFPTIAEGCGLPLLEALWHGTPCVASDVPSLVENAREGGCLILPTGGTALAALPGWGERTVPTATSAPLPHQPREAWTHALRRLLTEPGASAQLAAAARARAPRLPTWAQTAALIKAS